MSPGGKEKVRKQSLGVQSVETGSSILSVLAHATGPMSLTALSKAARVSTSQAHKYLTSFMRSGLVCQLGYNGQYDLGPLALQLGLTALRRIDGMELAQAAIRELRDELKITASIAVWGPAGPTLVASADYRDVMSVSNVLGSVVPLLASSIGQVFAAFLSRSITGPMIKTEFRRERELLARIGVQSLADFEKLLERVRSERIALNIGTVHPGFSGLSTPVFNHTDEIALSLNVASLPGAENFSPTGKIARTLLAKARGLSERLGARPS